MAAADTDLLFGLIALQVGLIDQAQLVAAFQAWARDKNTSLADHLTRRGELDREQRAAVEAMVTLHLKKHDGEAEKSLASIPTGRSTREQLAAIGDAVLANTIARVGSDTTEPESERTATYALGSATSNGQRFRVLRPHAQGGLGAVFVALDNELHREVALKQIHVNHADDETSRRRFLLEAEITGGLEHPGIVPVYGLGCYGDGRPYYAMRFIRGDSLKEAIQQFHANTALKENAGARSIELQKLLRRFLDVCNAIEYAHDRGVLHRDIKPGNIIVGRHGETLVVDWGLAKVLNQAETSSAKERPLVPNTSSGSAETLPGSALGTPSYMSPEQARGDLESLGPASDVYSLGATLYCVLTGRAPFEGDDIGAVLRAVERGDLQPPRAVDPTIDRALEAVCLKAMAVKPQDRYQTPRALADDIECWLADEPVSAYHEPWPKRARRRLKRHRSLLAALAIVLPITIISLATLAVRESLMNEQLETTNSELSRANRSVRDALERAQKREELSFLALDNYRRVVEENPDLMNSPDLLPLRRKLLEAPLDFYRQLRKDVEEVDRDRTPREREEIRSRVAHAEFGLAYISAEIGSETDAIKAYQQGIDLLTPMAGEESSISHRHTLAMTLNNLANLYVDGGRLTEGRAAHERALTIREELARLNPDVPNTRSALAYSYHNLGWVECTSGDFVRSLSHFRKARAIRDQLLRDDPSQKWSSIELAQTCNSLGWSLSRVKQNAEARECLQRARDLLEGVIKIEPTNVSVRGELAMAYGNLAVLEEGEAGLGLLRRALALREGLARELPSHAKNQSELADSLMNLGTRLRTLMRFDEALPMLERSRAVLEKIAREHPDSALYAIRWASGLNHLCLTLREMDRPTEAVAQCTPAIDLLTPLLQRETSNAELRSLLAGTLNNRGLALASLGRHEEAIKDFQGAIQEERVCFERSPDVFQYRDWLNNHYCNLGKSLRAAGRVTESVEIERVRMKLWPRDLGRAYDPGASYYNNACFLTMTAMALGQGQPERELNQGLRAERARLFDEAIKAFQIAIDDGYKDLQWILSDPELDALRNRPDFQAILLKLMDRAFPTDPFARGG